MSTYWGYVCRSHIPNIISDHWLNHGEDELRDVARLVRLGAWPDHPHYGGPIGFYFDGTTWTDPIIWLRQHPHCDVALHNEYGGTEELAPGQEPPGRCDGVAPTGASQPKLS